MRNEGKKLNRFIRDVKKYRGYTVYAAKSALKSEVANSHLSWLWWILDPLLFMIVYSFVSLVVFRKKEPYLPVFIFIGFNCWNFFSGCLQQSVKLVTANRSIVSRVYLPKFILVFERMITNGFKMTIAFSLVVIMMIGYQVPVDWKVMLLFPLLLMLLVVTFAFSSLLLHFGVYVEDLANVTTVVLKLAFYMSGIIYSIEKRVPYPYNSLLLKCNPMALLVDSMRKVLIYRTMPDWAPLLVWFIIGLIFSVIGVHNIYKHENSYVKVI